MAQRIALFDNLKGIAILLVVLGHFVEQATYGDASHILQTVLTYIYIPYAIISFCVRFIRRFSVV